MALYPLLVNARTENAYYSSPTEAVALVPTVDIVSESSASAGGLDSPRTATTARQSVASVYTKKASSVKESESTSTYEQMVLSAFPDAPIMLHVARAESHMIPGAKNPRSTATGLFQVLNGTARAYGCGDQTVAEESIKCARKIYDAEGVIPWKSSSANW